MWKPEHCCAADRLGLRYASNLTNAEWALVEPVIPPPRPATGPISRNAVCRADFERCARTVAAFVRLAMICVMLRPSTNPSLCSWISTSRIGSRAEHVRRSETLLLVAQLHAATVIEIL